MRCPECKQEMDLRWLDGDPRGIRTGAPRWVCFTPGCARSEARAGSA